MERHTVSTWTLFLTSAINLWILSISLYTPTDLVGIKIESIFFKPLTVHCRPFDDCCKTAIYKSESIFETEQFDFYFQFQTDSFSFVFHQPS